MKQFFPIVFVLTLVLTGIGCSSNSALVSDFNPTKGAATNPNNPESDAEGPFKRQLMTAVSYDGYTYIPNDVWISDQANVPDIVQAEDKLYLYYTGWVVGDRLNSSAVAISEDEGRSWVYKYLEIQNLPKLAPPADPDIILLDDGTFRLYFTSGDGKFSGIHYAEGVDGINFDYKGTAVFPTDTWIMDSTTFYLDGQWHMYVLADLSIETLWHLISDDGIEWEITEKTSFPILGTPHMPSNGILIDDVYHLFMFNPQDGTVRSQYTTDSYNWTVDEGVRIGPLDDGRKVGDSAVVQTGDTYLMIYTTNVVE
jgi:hypothetical protein